MGQQPELPPPPYPQGSTSKGGAAGSSSSQSSKAGPSSSSTPPPPSAPSDSTNTDQELIWTTVAGQLIGVTPDKYLRTIVSLPLSGGEESTAVGPCVMAASQPNGIIYVASAASLLAFSVADRQVLWTHPLGGASRPLGLDCDGNNVYCVARPGGANPTVYGYLGANGAPIWSWLMPKKSWFEKYGAPVLDSHTSAETVLMGTNATVYALAKKDGALLWKWADSSWFGAPITWILTPVPSESLLSGSGSGADRPTLSIVSVKGLCTVAIDSGEELLAHPDVLTDGSSGLSAIEKAPDGSALYLLHGGMLQAVEPRSLTPAWRHALVPKSDSSSPAILLIPDAVNRSYFSGYMRYVRTGIFFWGTQVTRYVEIHGSTLLNYDPSETVARRSLDLTNAVIMSDFDTGSRVPGATSSNAILVKDPSGDVPDQMFYAPHSLALEQFTKALRAARAAGKAGSTLVADDIPARKHTAVVVAAIGGNLFGHNAVTGRRLWTSIWASSSSSFLGMTYMPSTGLVYVRTAYHITAISPVSGRRIFQADTPGSVWSKENQGMIVSTTSDPVYISSNMPMIQAMRGGES